MKTIKTLVDYTKSKKKHQLEKKDYFYIEPIKDIEEYIRNEKSVAGIGLALDFISSWFHYNYIYSFLTTTDSATTDLSSRSLKTIFQHKACTVKLYADSFYKVQKNSHSSFEVICCRS